MRYWGGLTVLRQVPSGELGRYLCICCSMGPPRRCGKARNFHVENSSGTFPLSKILMPMDIRYRQDWYPQYALEGRTESNDKQNNTKKEPNSSRATTITEEITVYPRRAKNGRNLTG